MSASTTEALQARLQEGAAAMGLELPAPQLAQLMEFLVLLQKWNKVYNLTAVRDPQEMLTHHLLDSLAAVLPLRVCFRHGARLQPILAAMQAHRLPAAQLRAGQRDYLRQLAEQR